MAKNDGLRFTVDKKNVEQWLDLSPKKTSLAIWRAVKRGTLAARTAAARLVSRDMGIKVSDARRAIGTVAPTFENVTGKILGKLKRLPLMAFGAKGPIPSRGKGRGVSYKAKGGRRTLPSAFIAPVGGKPAVLKRKGKERLPIRQLYGPSVGRVVDEHREAIKARGAEVATKEINRQLDRIFGKSK